jgi:uncharacterized protein
MYVAALTLDVLLGDVRSLKQKRGVVRPLVAELRRRYPGIAVAETGHLDLHRRAEIGVAVVSDTAGNATKLLDECERIVASHPEIELLSARHRLYNEEELPTRRVLSFCRYGEVGSLWRRKIRALGDGLTRLWPAFP